LTVFAPSASADVVLPRIFGNQMVFQRDMPVWVWGKADPGEAIAVMLAGHETHSQADAKGLWKIKMPAMQAGGPHELIVKGVSTIRLTDILVGDVWVCSGQSNMEWPIARVNNPDEVAAAADHPKIRLFHIARTTSGQPVWDVNAEWHPCNPETVKNFSAVAYFFGRELHMELGVPIGLINTSWGGTRIEPWTPPEGFASVPEVASYVNTIEEADQRFRADVEKSLSTYKEWINEAGESLKNKTLVPNPPPYPRHPLDNHGQPTGLYNGMIHPIVPFTIRGAIWYQGEANLNDGMEYHYKMKALIQGWRKVWNQGDFPFYYVQLAPFIYRRDPELLPRIWEAQTATLSVQNTGMAVITDIANLQDIHPRNKLDVGKRLALWALVQTHGRKDLVYSGPIYRSMTEEGNRIRIHFDHVGGGLESRDGKPLSWFQIAGADRTFVKARAVIDGETVLVDSEEVKKPRAVRFGFHETAEPNLVNKAGLPASPFRTDAW
jgi:sialate O-acetylesterase